MAHEIESMMYVNKTPWHGLGIKLEAPPTIADAIKLSGLDWKVELIQLSMPDGRKVDRYATVRSTDQKILGTVGPGYRPLQNDKAFDFFAPFVENGAATVETAGSLRGGSRVWMLAKIDRADSVIVKKADDRVAKYLLLANGHDGSLATMTCLTPIRVVCQNTLNAAITDGISSTVKIRHTASNVDVLAEVQATIQKVDADFEKVADVFRALAGRKVRSSADLRAYVDAVFSPRKSIKEVEKAMADSRSLIDQALEEAANPTLESLLQRSVGSGSSEETERKSKIFEEISNLFEHGRGNDVAGVRGTAWAAYNAVTEHLTWTRGRTQDARLDALWMKGAGVAQRAATVASSMFLGS